MTAWQDNAAALDAAGLALARRLGTFALKDIAAGLGIGPSRAGTVCARMVDAGQATRLRVSPNRPWTYTATEGVEAAPSRNAVVDPAERMWTAIRKTRAFTVAEIAVGGEVDDEAARAYCQFLMAAGYLVAVRKHIPGRQVAVYRLVRPTGPKAPREKRVRAIADPNLGTVVMLGGVMLGGQP